MNNIPMCMLMNEEEEEEKVEMPLQFLVLYVFSYVGFMSVDVATKCYSVTRGVRTGGWDKTKHSPQRVEKKVDDFC